MMKPYQLALALLLPAQAMAAESVHFTFDGLDSVLMPLEIVSLDLVGTYSGPNTVVGGGVDIGFNSAVAQVLSVTLVAPHGIAESTGTINNVAGTVTDIGFADFGGVSGTFTLATVQFQALAPGFSPLTLVASSNPVWAWGNDVAPDYTVESITSDTGSITVVPEPETWAMLLAGLSLVGLRVARRKT